jgi:hypothetical protein
MKKLFIILAAAAMAVSVNAAKGDMVLSGSLGFATGDNIAVYVPQVDETFEGKGTMFSIAPNFTYFLSNKFGIGGKVGVSVLSPDGGDTGTIFGVGVFGRYYLYQTEKFGIFAHAGLDVDFASEEFAGTSFTLVNFGVKPGIQYFINKKWSVETSFANILNLVSVSPKDGDSSTAFDLNVNPFALDFAPLTLTVNYHF